MISASLFIAKAEEIANEGPSYRSGGSGTDGTCDCIGLVIGAIRRAGGQWRGLHGSNYAARKETSDLKPITGTGDLIPGEVVYKAYEPGQGGYNLPAKYERSGDYYTGDLRDYFHVGIVESVYPLRIRHMTTPKPKMDTSIGKWTHHGKLIKVSYSGGGSSGGGGNPGKKEEQSMKIGTVTANSKTVKLRATASESEKLYYDIPVGASIEVYAEMGDWSQVKASDIKGAMHSGYMKSEFIKFDESTPSDTTPPSGSVHGSVERIRTLMDSIEKELAFIESVTKGGE